MGVHGLWRLIEPSGKPVPLETLENKILAVDVSIWLHQAIKGFQDSRGAPVPNAHLLGIYHRVCKLLYFRIRPVFVFDGGVPGLKKQTIFKRNQQKQKLLKDAGNIQSKLISTLLKHTAIKNILSEQSTEESNPKNASTDDLYKLPPAELDSTIDSASSSDESISSPIKQWDLHTIDEKSEEFTSLPADIRHEILTELIETRKQSSWGRIHELPKESGNFSQFQMKRLLKRFSVQTSLEAAEKEMGGHSLSLGELEKLLNEEGIVTSGGCRIASDEKTRYLLIKDIKKTLEEHKQTETKPSLTEITSNDKELEKDLAAAIRLSLQDQPSTSKNVENESSFLERFNDEDFESVSEQDEEEPLSILMQARSYMTEYSGLTPSEIEKILDINKRKRNLKTSKINSPENLELENVCNKAEDISETSEADLKIPVETSKTLNLPQCNIRTENIRSENGYKISEDDLKIAIEASNKLEDVCKTSLEADKTFDLSQISHLNERTKTLESEDACEITKDYFKTSAGFCNILEDAEASAILDKPTTSKVNARTTEKVLETRIVSPEPSKIIPEKPKLKDLSKDIKTSIQEESIEVSSDSDDSDFVEVNDNNLEILINPNADVAEDLFSDVFEKKELDEPKQNSIEVEKDLSTENIEALTDLEHSVEINDKIEVEDSLKDDNVQVEVSQPKLTVEDLNSMKSDLETEKQQLLAERNAKERIAGNITDQMYQEAQELLELFGVPYIVAPMEAEAQCAFLNEINLTDGTITDDSDIWLFGGKTVYKNFFNHNKHVMEFRAENIEYNFKLTREQLILLALLVGSDYTLGIQGIGPVTALEILAAFPPVRGTNLSLLSQPELLAGLLEFRKWLLGDKAVGLGRTSLRSKLRNIKLSEGFPNLKVINAYLQPEVETCKESFTWAKPDVGGLIEYAKDKFGWTKLKSEEILKPVIRKLDERNIQKSIKDYFQTKHKLDSGLVQNQMSKRVKTAVGRIGKPKEELTESTVKKKETKGRKTKKDETEKPQKPQRELRVKKPVELHTKEKIPQKEMDKRDALKNKLKAIEIFRKSKQGPGYLKKKQKVVRKSKEEAELSESSSSD